MDTNRPATTKKSRCPGKHLTQFTLVTAVIFLGGTAIRGNAATENTSYLKSVAITDAAGANAPPTAVINYSKNGDVYTFDASQSSDTDGSIVSYKWNFGDGSLVEGVSINQQLTANPAQVTLTVVDDRGGVMIAQTEVTASFEIIIDNSDPQFSTTGIWRKSTTVSGYWGDNYVYTNKSDGPAKATWTIEIPTSGRYEVFCYYSSAPTWRSTSATYTVNNNGSVLGQKMINQKENGSVFNSLGIYELKTDSINVTLVGDTVGDVAADAIKMVYMP